MIQLKRPLLWDGHIVSKEKTVSLSADMEKRIVSAGNAEYVKAVENVEPKEEEPPKRSEPGTGSEPPADPPQTSGNDPELNLGRGGPAK